MLVTPANLATGFRPVVKAAPRIGLVQVNTGLTWTLAANPGNGNTRITSSGAHGLTSGVAVGKNIYISAWSGNGIIGLYQIATVVDTTNLDIVLVYSASLGNPTVAAANTEVTLRTDTIPGNLIGPNGCLLVGVHYAMTLTSNNKTFRIKIGGVTYFSATLGSIQTVRADTDMHNLGATNQQAGGLTNQASGAGGSGSALITSSIDTTQPFNVTYTVINAVVNEVTQLDIAFIQALYLN